MNSAHFLDRRARLIAIALMAFAGSFNSTLFGADPVIYSVLDFESDTVGEKPDVSDAGYTPGSNSSVNGVVVIDATSTPVANPLSGKSLYAYDLGTESGNSTHFRYSFNGDEDVSNVRVDFDFQRGYEVAAPEGDTAMHVGVGRATAGSLNNSDFRPFRLSLFNDGTMSIDSLDTVNSTSTTTALGTFNTVDPNHVSLLVNSHDTENVDYDLEDLGVGTLLPNTVHVFYNDANLGAFDFFVTPDPANAAQIVFNTENNDLGKIALFQDTNSEGGIVFDNIVIRSVDAVVETVLAPSGLSADSVDKTSVALSWTDNSDNEAAFLVERSTGIAGPFEEIAELAANSVSYVDNDADPQTTYFYRVTVTNGFSSESTATLEVTTLEQIEPIIVDSSASGVALANSTIPISVTAIGRDPIAYQWYVGQSGDVANPVNGANSATLEAAVFETAISYWVRVSNAEASVDSETFAITIIDPSITIVRREADLRDVFEVAVPGDEIVIANGTYSDYGININASGSESARLIVRAETPGGVTLMGKSFIKFGGDYITVSGFRFTNAGNYDEEIGSSVIQFRSNNGNKHAHYGRLTDCVIDDMNSWEQDVDDDDEDGDSDEFIFHNSKWIQLYGTNHRIDHCYFANKKVRGALLLSELIPQDGENGTPYPEYNHRIDHNYFGPIPVGFSINEFETIRLGTSDFANFNGNMVVENNYFYHCDGEIEVISNKSSGNTYRNNTLIGCRGSLVMRHGDFCTVEGNIIIGEGLSSTGGIRLNGEGHTVVNNYVSGVRGTGLRAAFVMRAAGGVNTGDTNGGYEQVRNALVAFNTFYDNTQTFNLGELGSKDNSLPPTDSTIANNIVESTKGTLVTIGRTPTAMTYEGNMMFGSPLGIASSGFQEIDPLLEKRSDGLYRPGAGSPAMAGSVGVYSSVIFDIDGEVRPSSSADVGADQVSESGVSLAPLDPSLLGPSWMRADGGIEILNILRAEEDRMEVIFTKMGAVSANAFELETASNLQSPSWQSTSAVFESLEGDGIFKVIIEFDDANAFWRLVSSD